MSKIIQKFEKSKSNYDEKLKISDSQHLVQSYIVIISSALLC
jgi:hypothetical protein